MANFEMTWQAPEYEYHEKTVSWYWISIIVAAVIIGFSVWEKNFLFGLFVVIAEILFIIWGERRPRMLDFVIDQDYAGVVGGKNHLLKELESFSVETIDDDWTELIFIFRAKLKTPFKIIFPTARLQELRNNLKTLLKEVPYEQTFLDSIEKLLRF